MSHQAMSDMRLMNFELRPAILEQSGLVMALQSRLESVEAKEFSTSPLPRKASCIALHRKP